MNSPLSANRIIWHEIAAFSLILLISWANELGDLTQRLIGGSASSNWREAVVESTITLAVAIPTILLSWRLSRRLHYLEGFLRVCAWCRKVGQGDDWISIEEYVEKNFKAQTSHGMCPACSQKFKEEEEN